MQVLHMKQIKPTSGSNVFEYTLIIAILLLAFFLRVIHLDKIPTGINSDEMDYVFTAKTVALTGYNLAGNWAPYYLRTPPDEIPKAELPYVFLLPFVAFTPFSLFWARLPFVIYNVLLVYVLYGIGRKLYGTVGGLATGFLAAINPWHIFFGRTGFDAPLAVTAFFTALFIVLTAKPKLKIVAALFFSISFFLYIGIKIVFLPLVFWILWWAWRNKYVTRNTASISLGITILVVMYYLFFGSTSLAARKGEIFLPTDNTIIQTVDWNRKNSVTSPFKVVFDNKLSVYVRQLSEKYIKFFSPEYLLLFGDSRSSFSVWSHGVLYFLDGVCILVGLYWLFMKARSELVLLLGILLLAPLPSVFSNVGITYSIRSSLGIPIFILLSGAGLGGLISVGNNVRVKIIISLLLLIGYVFFTLQFMYIYLYRNPVYNAEGFAFSERIIASYISRARQKGASVSIAMENGQELVKQYVFYQNRLDKKTIPALRQLLGNKSNEFEGITLTHCTPDIFSDTTTNKVIVTTTETRDCQKDLTVRYLSVSQLSDGGEIYKIFHDPVCGSYILSHYPRVQTLNDFNVESLTDEMFCTRFISDLQSLSLPPPQSGDAN